MIVDREEILKEVTLKYSHGKTDNPEKMSSEIRKKITRDAMNIYAARYTLKQYHIKHMVKV